MWGWVELKYADGLTLVLEGSKWGQRYDRKQGRGTSSPSDLDEEGRKKLEAMPDPEPLLTFVEAVKTRKEAGGHVEAAHRAATHAAPVEHRHPPGPQDPATTRSRKKSSATKWPTASSTSPCGALAAAGLTADVSS